MDIEKKRNSADVTNNPWGEAYLNEVPDFGASEKEKVPEYRTLEELRPLLQDERYMIWGHGTGWSVDDGVVEAIFQEGMIASGDGDGFGYNDDYYGKTDLTGNAVCLDTEDLMELKDELDNWRHRDSKNVILMRLPIDKLTMTTLNAGERYAAYYIKKTKVDEMGNKNSQIFLDPRLIIGNYNAKIGKVEMNPQFEAEPSEDLTKQMEAEKAKVEAIVKERVANWAEGDPCRSRFGDVDEMEDSEEDGENTFHEDIDWNDWE